MSSAARPSNATKTVAVLGGSYGGYRAATLLGQDLPEGWRVILVDRNTHANHVYNLARFGVLAGHEHKAFIPYTKVFPATEHPHRCIHGRIMSLAPHSLTLTSTSGSPVQEELHFDYAIYALGSHLPAPINLWGPAPSASTSKGEEVISVGGYGGTKCESIEWLKGHQSAVEEAGSVLVVGGGALGVQYATDIAAVYPTKRVTLLHSRHRLLPKFDEMMHSEIMQAMEDANIDVILGERLSLETTRERPPKRNTLGQRVVKTEKGQEIAADLILLCTGQKANTELLEEMDSSTIVPENGQAKVLRTMQLATVVVPSPFSPPTATSTLPSTSGTPAPEPAYARAEDERVDTHELEVALERVTLQHEIESSSSSPVSSESSPSESMSLVSSASEVEEEATATPYPHIFVVGDAADAFGAINAGHTAHFQAEVAARNVLKLVRREAGLDTPEDAELELYTPTAPGIKVSLGLKKSVYQMHGVIGTKEDGTDDLDASVMWGFFGHGKVSNEDMKI